MKPAAAVLFSLAFAGVCACGEKCDPEVDRPYCDGKAVVSCPLPGVDQLVGTDRWVRRECLPAQSCVALQPEGATCALESEPSALCAEARSAACESATSHVYCSLGYVTARAACFSCLQTGTSATCEGGPSTPCKSAAECASGDCSENGYCR